MNPFIHKQLEVIDDRLKGLREILEKQSAKIDTEKANRERDLTRILSTRKEITALKRVAEDYDQLDAEHAKCLEVRQTAKDSLARILKHVKALSAEYRP